jgi:membrane-bound lytic murein transglycosylase B
VHVGAGARIARRTLLAGAGLALLLVAPPARASVDGAEVPPGSGSSATTSSTTTLPSTPPPDGGPPPASPPTPPEGLPAPPELPPPAAEPSPVVAPPSGDARLARVTADTGLLRDRLTAAGVRVAALEGRLHALRERAADLRARARRLEAAIAPMNRRLEAARAALVDTVVAAYRSGGSVPARVLVAADDPVQLDRLATFATAGTAAARTRLEKVLEARGTARATAADVATAIPPVEARIDDVVHRQLPAARATVAALQGQASTPTAVPVSGLDIPVVTLDAYLRAETTAAADQPGCRIAWWALAGVGRIESNHARYGGSYPVTTGDVEPPIVGIALDGNGVAAIGDTDGGQFDFDTRWDRAVGPMQFIPSTWQGYAADGNGDGVSSPHNVYDAAVAAAAYLCRGGGGTLDTEDDLRRAFLAYNHSSEYAERVLDYALAYRDAGLGR